MHTTIRNIFAFIFLFMLSCQLSFATLTKDDEGYYLIESASDLVEYRDNVNSGKSMDGRLTADIDLKSVCGEVKGENISWTPINTEKVAIKFDGANHTISNLYINTNNGNQGLFYCADEVKDLTLKNIYVKGNDNVGGLSATGEGSNGKCLIVNCHIDGVVKGWSNVGGFVGFINSETSYIVNCCNNTIVLGGNDVGGFCGTCYNTTFCNCYNLGRVKAVSLISPDLEMTYNGIAGGFAGCIDGCNFYNCYNYNKISGLASGSIIGHVLSDKEVTFNNCFSLTDMAKDNAYQTAVRNLAITSFKNGTMQKNLNLYLKTTPTCELPSSSDISYNWTTNIILYNEWVQVEDEDDYPRFDGVDFSPSSNSIVTYRGDLFDIDIVTESMKLPTCENPLFEYSFENSFDGKNVVSDTVVLVEKILKKDFLEMDKDGFYIIHNGKELSLFRDAVNSGANTIKGKLMDNINMASESLTGWTPIGDDKINGNIPFSGVFDGNDYTIFNLQEGNNLEFAGLFSYVKNATIQNVSLKNSTFTGIYAGAICAYAESSVIVNCGNEATIKSTSYDGAAGFCAVVDECLVANCYNIGEIHSEGRAAGLLGIELGNSKIYNCYTSCIISIDSAKYGNRSPFIFENWNADVSNCYYDSTLFNISDNEVLLVNELANPTNTTTIKTNQFIAILNDGVDSLNSKQDTIVYRSWVKGDVSSYPKFQKDESVDIDNCPSNRPITDSIVVYSVNQTLYIESTKEKNTFIYNMKGQMVLPIFCNIGLTEVYGLPQGIYVIEGKRIILK